MCQTVTKSSCWRDTRMLCAKSMSKLFSLTFVLSVVFQSVGSVNGLSVSSIVHFCDFVSYIQSIMLSDFPVVYVQSLDVRARVRPCVMKATASNSDANESSNDCVGVTFTKSPTLGVLYSHVCRPLACGRAQFRPPLETRPNSNHRACTP